MLLMSRDGRVAGFDRIATDVIGILLRPAWMIVSSV